MNQHYRGLRTNLLLRQAFKKYGLANFSLHILEYCDLEVLLKREQYNFDLFNPEYNLLKNAGNSLGYKHSEFSIQKMSQAKKGEKNPLFGLTGENHHLFGKLRLVFAPLH